MSGKGIIINHCGTSSHFNFAETQNKEAVALESALSRWIGLGRSLCERVALDLQACERATEQKLIQIPLTTTNATSEPLGNLRELRKWIYLKWCHLLTWLVRSSRLKRTSVGNHNAELSFQINPLADDSRAGERAARTTLCRSINGLLTANGRDLPASARKPSAPADQRRIQKGSPERRAGCVQFYIDACIRVVM